MKFLWARGKNPVRGCLPEILLIMRLTTLFVLLASLHVSAGGYAQGKISLTLRDAPLEVAFKEVLKQSGGYNFVGKPDLLKLGKTVSLNLKDVSLVEALNECFRGQPLTYEIQERIVVVKLLSLTQQKDEPSKNGPPGVIRGRIVDSVGSPLEGASVQVKGTKVSVETDRNGNFEIKSIEEGSVLEVSYTGYQNRSIRLVQGQSDLTISLKISSSPLDEIQVIAYGSTTQRMSTGNVTTVTSKEMEMQPVYNSLLALEGRVPGLYIAQASGISGGAVKALIQGQNSIESGNDPLYVIDGVPFSSQLLPNIGGMLGTAFTNAYNNANGSPLNYINPQDIESISILKDADATAIYGSRAANGAILITTKKGKVGKMKVDINYQDGWGQVTRRLKLMNTKQYVEMRNEAFQNDGATPSPNYDYDLTSWDTTRYTDLQKSLIGSTAKYSNLFASVSGGNAYVQYLIGGSLGRQTSVFPGNSSDQKGSVHFNINGVSENHKFHIQLSGSYMADDNRLPSTDLTNAAIVQAPNAPQFYNKDGSINWAEVNGTTSWYPTSPIAYTFQKYKNLTNNLISDANMSYEFFPGLSLKSNFGYNMLESNEIQTFPLSAVPPEQTPYTNRVAIYGKNGIDTWIIEPQLNFKKRIGRGNFDALVGSTFQQTNSNGQQIRGINYSSDLVLEDIGSAAQINTLLSIATIYKYNALFGRISYNWNEKYILDLTARRDGSSRFGPENQFHDFGAAGIAWIFTKERIFEDGLSALSFGKIRASYGLTGNDQIGNYEFLNLYSPVNVGVPYQGSNGTAPTSLTNPYLQWESTRKLSVGADLGFLKDKILLKASYAGNRSSNELLGYPLPIIAGFNYISANLPATVQNTSWEISLNTTNIKSKDFTWISSFNVTVPKNKLISFPGLSSSAYASTLVISKPINIIKAYHLIGVNDSTGIYQFRDSKGSATYNPTVGTDQTDCVNINPKFYGGFRNEFYYKGFELDFLLQFVNQIGLNQVFGVSTPPGTEDNNQPTYVLDRWQKPGDNKPIEKFSQNFSLFGSWLDAIQSQQAYSNASYLRLKNLSLAWNIPKSWSQASRLGDCRLYIQGQNLLTITKFKGMDPENQSVTSIPPLRVVAVGIKVGL